RTKLVVCQNASTEQIIHIAHYTDQEGRSPLAPFSGGFDPDDPAADGEGLPVTEPVEPSGTCPTPEPSFPIVAFTDEYTSGDSPASIICTGELPEGVTEV